MMTALRPILLTGVLASLLTLLAVMVTTPPMLQNKGPWQAQATSPPMARITDSLTLGKLRDMEQVKVKGLLKDGG